MMASATAGGGGGGGSNIGVAELRLYARDFAEL
jgi:hypothetical protein